MSSSEWKKTTLEQVCQIICGATPSTSVPEYWSDEIKWATAKDVSESTGYKIFDTERKISKLGFEKCSTKMIPSESTILIARGATMGRSCMLGIDMAINQTCYALVPNRNKIDPYFLFYSIKLLNSFFLQIAHGAIFNTVIGSGLRGTEISLPPLPTQRRIADILSALDEKIELNRQTNATLEAIAQAIFKEWFVDFNFPGSAALTTGGATGELVESELGLIPSGWRVGTLEEVAVFQRGFDLPSHKRISGDYPIIAASGPSGTHNKHMVKGPGVTTGRSGVLGNVYFVHDDYWPLNTSLWTKEFRNSTPTYLYYFLRGVDFGALNGGSAVPTLNRNHLHALPALIPPINLVEFFDHLVLPIKKQQKANEDESLSLAAQRDNLLPKLMNGEIPV